MSKYIIREIGLLEPADIDNPDYKPVDPGQVEVCKAWIEENLEKRPGTGVDRWHTSYGLKHMVERDAGEYVTNGAFIRAALDLGYRIRPTSYASHNAYLGFWFQASADQAPAI
jgi:hypothetical protein